MFDTLITGRRAALPGHAPRLGEDGRAPWSRRRKLVFLLLCGAGSWTIVLAPLLLLA